VTVTDGGDLTSSARITINVVDANYAPTCADAAFSIDENSAVNAKVSPDTAMSATDQDTGDTLRWTLVNDNIDGAFQISSTTGKITVAKAILDHEARPEFNITVQVQDSGAGRLTGTCFAAISISDVNEAPTLPTLGSMEIREDAMSGFNLGAVLGSDVDDGDVLTYSITAGDSSSAFNIDSSSGNVTRNN